MAYLGIDHPLIAVRDLEASLAYYRALGFFIAPPGQHPWGTSTALALFRRQILEIVSIGDAALLDGYAAGDFRFGRHVETYLARDEGVALTALFTEDAAEAETVLTGRGMVCAGSVHFGRDVRRADGQADRTRTTLKIFPNAAMPRLSVFACQQHRRDLVEFPERMIHPNGAEGFAAVTIVAPDSARAAVGAWLTQIHGGVVRRDGQGHDLVDSSNGTWRIASPAQFAALYDSTLPEGFLADGPRIAGLDLRLRDLSALPDTAPLRPVAGAMVAADMARLGGVALRFVDQSIR